MTSGTWLLPHVDGVFLGTES